MDDESSLFVSQRRIILKTCGNTTPLQCLKFLWALVKEVTGFDCIEDLYYSHKNYKRPHMQKLPYRKFDNEVAILDDFFRGAEGSAYCLGSMNRDCWYLYTYHHPLSTKHVHHGLIQRVNTLHNHNGHHGLNHHCQNHHHNHHGCKKHGRKTVGNSAGRIVKGGQVQGPQLGPAALQNFLEPDQTLEVLMTELDPKVMAIFTQKESSSAVEATEKSGINKIIPGMFINDHLFEPCGYSMNGIMTNGTYMTIHITPESEFSYVSFETNIAMHSYKELIDRVVSVFRPGKFVLTFFANKVSKGYNAHQEMSEMESVKGQWLRMDNQFCRLKKNDLTYAMYTKYPS
ncbi:S-adenosylmethionine decarboxylase proenzyme [Orchesella cincta]|uniref:S-adenosylmethionine decarboxylase proenzyme n=1 Tax=Orchesella cincta TaxID=48709 RepID=A0A1D2MKC8_ORCCI|nr:S-adenosylmethionine decarboxylase proenzyme [Orchesella cincta]